MNKLEFFIGIMAAVGMTACSSDEPMVDVVDDFGYKAVELSRAEQQVADASYVFGWNLLGQADDALPGENVCVSPVGANLILSMLVNGSEGETRSEIVNALGLAGMSLDEINENSQFMSSRLIKNDKDVQIYLANSMWIVDDTPVKSSFKSSMTSIFDAYVANTTSSKYADDVNAWCSKHTNGLIPSYVRQGESSELTLLNALYFKNVWKSGNEFKSAGEKSFVNYCGEEKSVPFMSGKIECGYNETQTARYAHLPFKDSNYALLIGLPNEGFKIGNCISELKDIAVLKGGYKSATVDFAMPKYSIEGKQSLKDILIALGINRVFDKNAQLENISDEHMYVDKFEQGINFSVDEKGAVAAAVTSAEILSWSSYPSYIEEPMTVDRPFVFAVYEYSTKCILFAGKIENL